MEDKPEALAQAVDGPFKRVLHPISIGLAERIEGITETITTEEKVRTQTETTLLKSLSKVEFKSIEGLTHVHPVVQKLFQNYSIPNVPLADRLRYFLTAWKKLTHDQEILSVVGGYKIPFLY